MSGGTVQLRPLVAYVVLAALAGLMMTGAFNADPHHVIEAGPAPEKVSSTVSGEVRLGLRLSPGPSPVAPRVSPTGQPALVVHPIAQGATNGSSSYPPAPTLNATSPAPAATPDPPSVTQLEPSKPGKGKHKGKGKDKGKGGKDAQKSGKGKRR